MASIDGGKALHHGGQAVAGIDGSMLGSQGLWIVPGQGCKGAQSPCSGFNVAILHQAAIGHTLQHLFIGRQMAGYNRQTVEQRLHQGLGDPFGGVGRKEKKIKGMVIVLGSLLVPGKDDPVRKTQSLTLFLQSTAQFAISHQHHLVDWRKLGTPIKSKPATPCS